jgi:hypothetical protein
LFLGQVSLPTMDTQRPKMRRRRRLKGQEGSSWKGRRRGGYPIGQGRARPDPHPRSRGCGKPGCGEQDGRQEEEEENQNYASPMID